MDLDCSSGRAFETRTQWLGDGVDAFARAGGRISAGARNRHYIGAFAASLTLASRSKPVAGEAPAPANLAIFTNGPPGGFPEWFGAMAHSPSNHAPAHARIYDKWRALPAWRGLSCAARALLIEFLCDYRPPSASRESNNGRLPMSVRRAASALNVGKETAAAALIELEIAGWLTVGRLGNFGRRNQPSEFGVTMYDNPVTATPATFAFEHFEPAEPMRRARPATVRPQVHHSPDSGTRPSGTKDTKPKKYGPVQVSDALRNSPAFKRLGDGAGRGGK